MARRTVIVLGKGTLAIRVAGWFAASDEYELRYVVPVMPEPDWTDSFADWARAEEIRFVRSGHWADLPSGEVEVGADLGISVFYDRILPAGFLRHFGRLLNIHNAPLPRYRGVTPINWALKNGERVHGVSIHEITEGIDDGPVVAQLEYTIYPEFDEVIDVYERSLEYGWTLFTQTIPMLDRIEAVAQDESRATYYSAADQDRLGERRSFTRELSRLG